MNQIRSVAIIGLGVIGGSMAVTWKRTRPDLNITGIDDRVTLDAALGAGAIDRAALTIQEGVESSDLVVIATPLSAIPDALRSVGKYAREDAVVTDTASVKNAISDLAADYIPPSMKFVGGHPMTGSEKSGFSAADDFLFENSVYVLCPEPDSIEQTKEGSALVDCIRSLGARILVMDPVEHDRAAAAISHVPQLLSVALVNSAELPTDDKARLLAAGGFRDMTRIASSSFDMWRGIIAANHGQVLDKLGAITARIQQMRNRIIEEDYDDLARLFAEAEASRAMISTDTKGFLAPLADLLVRVHDRPGELKTITALLSDADINIKDLELLKLREGTGGTFRISFASDKEAASAARLLQEQGYQTRKP
ncbi:MAG: prephenate dehydrogenase [Rhodothermales bacterium]|nr:prephenate dehydrogenase [Rhodothermales bacterium]